MERFSSWLVGNIDSKYPRYKGFVIKSKLFTDGKPIIEDEKLYKKIQDIAIGMGYLTKLSGGDYFRLIKSHLDSIPTQVEDKDEKFKEMSDKVSGFSDTVFINAPEATLIMMDESCKLYNYDEDLIISKFFTGVPKQLILKVLKPVSLIFNPYKEKGPSFTMSRHGEDVGVFNTYSPPDWVDFDEENNLKPLIPPLILHYLINFFANDTQSLAISLSWISQIHYGKNDNYLFLKGNRGNGKTTASEFLYSFVGGHNSGVITQGGISGGFKGGVDNKTACTIDEPTPGLGKELAQFLKLNTNRHITMEKKFEEATQKENFCNFLITTNTSRSLEIDGDERRAIVPLLTEKKLDEVEYMSLSAINELKELLKNPLNESIMRFNKWLSLYGRVDCFHSSIYIILKGLPQCYTNSLSDWKRSAIEAIIREFKDTRKTCYTPNEISKMLRKSMPDSRARHSKASMATIIDFLCAHRIYTKTTINKPPYSLKTPIVFGNFDESVNFFFISDKAIKILNRRYPKKEKVNEYEEFENMEQEDEDIMAYDDSLEIDPLAEKNKKAYYNKWLNENVLPFIDKNDKYFYMVEKYFTETQDVDYGF